MILTIINQKGGVGKTTTAANVGAALACPLPARISPTAKNPTAKGPKLRLVDLDPQGSLLRYRRAIKHASFHAPQPHELAELLDGTAPAVVDCPPGLDEATRALLLSLTDVALIPLQPAYDALIGMVRTIEAVEAAQQENPRLQFKILLTMYRGKPNARQLRADVRAGYPLQVCKTAIPFSLLYEDAAAVAQPMLQYAPDAKATLSYLKLAEEIQSWQ